LFGQEHQLLLQRTSAFGMYAIGRSTIRLAAEVPVGRQNRFDRDVMRQMRVRSSGAIGWRPRLPGRRERRRQYVHQPWRCHRSTVSGFTMRREVCQPLNQRHAKIQKRRSASSRSGRGMRRCRTSSCCRRQRLSAISSAFGWRAAGIAHSKQRSIATCC